MHVFILNPEKSCVLNASSEVVAPLLPQVVPSARRHAGLPLVVKIGDFPHSGVECQSSIVTTEIEDIVLTDSLIATYELNSPGNRISRRCELAHDVLTVNGRFDEVIHNTLAVQMG